MTIWTDSPCVWRSWSCQLLRAEHTATEIVVDAIALEPLPSATAVVSAGVPFAIRVARDDATTAAIDVLDTWAGDLEPVLILGGRHRRRSWMCLSRRNDRLLLVGTVWTVRPPSPEPGDSLSATSGQEHRPTTSGPLPVPQPALLDAKGDR